MNISAKIENISHVIVWADLFLSFVFEVVNIGSR